MDFFQKIDIINCLLPVAGFIAGMLGPISGGGGGFFFMTDAIYSIPIGLMPYFAGSFSLAAIIGVLSLFAPAGIGVREGVLAMLALSGALGGALCRLLSTSHEPAHLLESQPTEF